MKNMKKNNIAGLMQEILKLREKRDWAQFHDPKNLAEAIAIESGELLEHFLWKTPEESKKINKLYSTRFVVLGKNEVPNSPQFPRK